MKEVPATDKSYKFYFPGQHRDNRLKTTHKRVTLHKGSFCTNILLPLLNTAQWSELGALLKILSSYICNYR